MEKQQTPFINYDIIVLGNKIKIRSVSDFKSVLSTSRIHREMYLIQIMKDNISKVESDYNNIKDIVVFHVIFSINEYYLRGVFEHGFKGFDRELEYVHIDEKTIKDCINIGLNLDPIRNMLESIVVNIHCIDISESRKMDFINVIKLIHETNTRKD